MHHEICHYRKTKTLFTRIYLVILRYSQKKRRFLLKISEATGRATILNKNGGQFLPIVKRHLVAPSRHLCE